MDRADKVENIPIKRAALGVAGPRLRSGAADGAGPLILRTAELMADYAGPMVLFDGAGTVLSANTLADPIVTALRGPMGGDLRTMLHAVLIDGSVQTKRFQLPVATGEAVFDITLLPENGAEESIAEAGGTGDADQAPERILLLARDSTFDVNFGRALVASRQLFKDLVSCSADFVWETDAEGCFAFVSGRGLLGYTPDELDGHPARDLLADPVADPVAQDGRDGGPNPFESQTPLDEVECWLLDRNDARVCVRVSCLPVFDDQGALQGVRGVCRDITEETLHQAALARAQERERLSRSIVDSIRDALTPDEMFSAAAAATAEAIKASHIWILRAGKNGRMDLAADRIAANAPDIDILQEAEQSFAGDLAQVRHVVLGAHQLLLVPCHFRHQPKGVLAVALEDAGILENAATTLLDIASQLGIAIAQAEVQERLEELSSVDELTGLLNRRGFYDTVGKRIAQHKRQNRFGALLYIDMDHFKAVNDTHGHQVGDAALVALARLLSNGDGRESDISGRLGGDEFAVWLEETGPEGARHKAEELLAAAVTSLERFSGDAAHPLSISIGIALADPNIEEDLDSLIHRADQALYRAKRKGRGVAVLAERRGADDDTPDAEGPTTC
ncbi:MAG: diguanylate cyclase [Alphaproteobacteria bacterium]|nr:diguanylate cyclase [Alphaproteobacteria bacterium]